MSAGLAVMITLAASMVAGVVATCFLERQDARGRDRLRERLEYATASRRYWQARAARAEHELSRSAADEAWPLYRPGPGRYCYVCGVDLSNQSGDPS